MNGLYGESLKVAATHHAAFEVAVIVSPTVTLKGEIVGSAKFRELGNDVQRVILGSPNIEMTLLECELDVPIRPGGQRFFRWHAMTAISRPRRSRAWPWLSPMWRWLGRVWPWLTSANFFAQHAIEGPALIRNRLLTALHGLRGPDLSRDVIREAWSLAGKVQDAPVTAYQHWRLILLPDEHTEVSSVTTDRLQGVPWSIKMTRASDQPLGASYHWLHEGEGDFWLSFRTTQRNRFFGVLPVTGVLLALIAFASRLAGC